MTFRANHYNQVRSRLGLTHEEIAARIGVALMTLNRWRRGVNLPSSPQLLALAQVLKVSPQDLLDDQVVPRRPDYQSRASQRAGWSGLARIIGQPDLAEASLRRRIRRLPDRERQVVMARFGLDGKPPAPLSRIAQDLGVSREWVRQIETSALKKFKRGGISNER